MFSIIIPLYNKSLTIERTILSLMRQQFDVFEIIIVDDGSTDNSLEVLMAIEINKEMRIVRQENSGVSAARNHGISLAKYEYIALLDADDEWEPNFLKLLKLAIEKFPNAGFWGASSWHRNLLTSEQSYHITPKYKDKISLIEYLLDPHDMPHTSAMVLSKKHFLQIDPNGEGFPVGMKVCEDWACFYRLAFISDFVYIGIPLGIRNFNVAGQITGLSREQRFALMPHVVNFYNITYDSWEKSIQKKARYLNFLRFDLRARIFASLKIDDFKTINYLLNGLNKNVLSQLSKFEISMYGLRKFKLLSLLYIAGTKIVWKTKKLK